MNDELIIALVEKFNAGSAAELEYKDEKRHLVLRKESALGRTSAPLPGAHPDKAMLPAHVTAHPQELHHITAHTEPSNKPNAQGEIVTSPIVATFYASASPDAPSFVSVGSKVKQGATLCILEAMKMMNQLEAEFDCEILSIQVKSGDFVEYGQALFEVKRL